MLAHWISIWMGMELKKVCNVIQKSRVNKSICELTYSSRCEAVCIWKNPRTWMNSWRIRPKSMHPWKANSFNELIELDGNFARFYRFLKIENLPSTPETDSRCASMPGLDVNIVFILVCVVDSFKLHATLLLYNVLCSSDETLLGRS